MRMKEQSKNQQILAYLASQKGCTLDTDAVAEMFGVHWRQVRNLAQMNIGFCTVTDRGHTIEVSDEDLLLSSGTSDSREPRRHNENVRPLRGKVHHTDMDAPDA
jgi:hypothetical protein